MKIVVFGQTGQVATELQRQADVIALARSQANLTDPAACAAIIIKTDADIIINAAAYTNVDKAENDQEIAQLVNGDAPAAMAAAAATKGIPFVHISTDYVFDGSGVNAWKVNDNTGPLGTYGRSKLAGENGVRAAGGVHAILRTSWVFSEHGNNFVKTMLRLGADRSELAIVADQIGGPTAAADIAATCLKIAKALHNGQGNSGTYHYCGTPDVSWADFAREIFAQSELEVTVKDIPTKDYPTPAKRPLNSRMDCASITREFGIERPDWHQSLRRVLTEMPPKGATHD